MNHCQTQNILVKLSPTDIENVKKYKYNGKDDSISAELFLRKYWDYLITFFPMTIAPNLITLIGFGVEIFSFLISFIVSDRMTKQVPGWVCILNGLCLWIYSTLDNLDGRQARRTNSSSALGQFFDHGCDAITGVLEMIKVSITFNFGPTSSTFYFAFLMGVGFFMTSWEEYVTHAFYLGRINGPDDGLLFLSIVQVLAGILPTSFVNAMALNAFTKLCFIICCIGTCVPIVYKVVKQSLEDPEKRNRAIFSIIPAIITIIIFILVASSSVESHQQKGTVVPTNKAKLLSTNTPQARQLEEETKKQSDLITKIHPYSSPFFIMGAALVLQYQSQQTIVSYLTLREPKRLFEPSIYCLWVFGAVPLLIRYFLTSGVYWFLYFVSIIGIMIKYDLEVILGFSTGLQIPILTLKPKDETPEDEMILEDTHEDFENAAPEAQKEVPLDIFKDVKDDEA